MKAYKTAALTAVWRKMGNVDDLSVKYVPFHLRIFARLLGMLDWPSVDTISKRAVAINSIIERINPKTIVEIGCGYSTRPQTFQQIKFYQLDLEQIADAKKDVISFDAGRDKPNLDINKALFIVEGLTMYLDDKEVHNILKEIKKYKGQLVIDFFNRQNSTKQKTFREKLYKLLFKMLIGKNHLFDFRIDDIESGEKLLKNIGFKNVKYIDYKIKKTLDSLFYAEF